MKIAILGFGREGQSLLKFLKSQKDYRKNEIWILDKNENLKIPKGVQAQLGEKYLSTLKRFDLIFRSPGIPYTLPQLYRARCKGTEVTSPTKLFFQLVPKNVKIIGVTGTKGKGTTCTLIYETLKAAGKKAVLAGNIGKPMLEILPKAAKADYIVLELSSFQLQDLSYSPAIAVVVDTFPDHLDQHGSLREYYGAKANIGRWQKKSDVIFYFADNKLSEQIAFKSPAKKIPVFGPDNLNRNKFMAAAVTKHLAVPEKIIDKTIKNFRGLEHRLEFVRSLKGITFINDTTATTPNSVAMAIRTLPGPIILIAGGKDKGLNFAPLAEEIKKSGKVKTVVLFGENREKIRKGLMTRERGLGKRKQELKIIETNNLEEAVKAAYKFAKHLIPSPYSLVTVLFSPASASFDQFKNYVERGEKFKKIVQSLNN